MKPQSLSVIVVHKVISFSEQGLSRQRNFRWTEEETRVLVEPEGSQVNSF
jgi:hypothetical protein